MELAEAGQSWAGDIVADEVNGIFVLSDNHTITDFELDEKPGFRAKDI